MCVCVCVCVVATVALFVYFIFIVSLPCLCCPFCMSVYSCILCNCMFEHLNDGLLSLQTIPIYKCKLLRIDTLDYQKKGMGHKGKQIKSTMSVLLFKILFFVSLFFIFLMHECQKALVGHKRRCHSTSKKINKQWHNSIIKR